MVQFSKPGGFGLVVIGIPPMQILNSKALHCALLLCDRAPFEQQWGIGKASGQQERVTAARRRVWAGCLGIFAVKEHRLQIYHPLTRKLCRVLQRFPTSMAQHRQFRARSSSRRSGIKLIRADLES